MRTPVEFEETAVDVTAAPAEGRGNIVDHDDSTGESTVGSDELGLLVAERERVARDLHDGVVQEVFATAMTLAALRPLVPPPVQPRLDELIDRQDSIVRLLRSTVFALRPPQVGRDGACAAITRIANEAARGLGFSPRVRLDGELDNLGDDRLVGHLLFASREMLSNVARHARASAVTIDVSLARGHVVLRVADDGIGISPDRLRHGDGLTNLSQRARELGGDCHIKSSPRHGTIVTWRALCHRSSSEMTSSSDTCEKSSYHMPTAGTSASPTATN